MITIQSAAEALFASHLQRSDAPTADAVEAAITITILQLGGIEGCACAVATEYGEHPETACDRMLWALNTVRLVYPHN